jgi:hypothetical protein
MQSNITPGGRSMTPPAFKTLLVTPVQGKERSLFIQGGGRVSIHETRNSSFSAPCYIACIWGREFTLSQHPDVRQGTPLAGQR